MQIKTASRFHLIPFRMAVIKKSNENKGCWEHVDQGTLFHCLWEYLLALRFLVVSFESLMYRIISVNRDTLTPSSPIYILLFSCIIALVETSSTKLNRSRESGNPCLVPDLRGDISHLPLFSVMLAAGLFCFVFLIWCMLPLSSTSPWLLSWRNVTFLLKVFLH